MGERVIVGVPREIKDNEYRVAVTPAGVRELTLAGHEVLVEESAGEGSSIPDEAYLKYGAEMAPDARSVFDSADLILKVKEPVPEEHRMLREGQILFTYLHLAASRELTQALAERKVSAVAYETVQLPDGRLPPLAPMSEMSDRLTLEQRVREADVVIGSVLVPGARAPKLITEDMIRSMRTGAVAIDIA